MSEGADNHHEHHRAWYPRTDLLGSSLGLQCWGTARELLQDWDRLGAVPSALKGLSS